MAKKQLLTALKDIFIKKQALFVFILLILTFCLFKWGICFIHEHGHYLTGRLFGCNTISITCNDAFSLNPDSAVFGWQSCNQLAVATDGSRVCNLKTYFILIAGFIFTSLIMSALVICSFIALKRIDTTLRFNRLLIGLLVTLLLSLNIASADFAHLFNCIFHGLSYNTLKLAFYRFSFGSLWALPFIWIFWLIYSLKKEMP